MTALTRKFSTNKQIPNDNPVVSEIWDRALLAFKTEAAAELDVDPSEISIEDGTQLTLKKVGEETAVWIEIKFPGTWTKD